MSRWDRREGKGAGPHGRTGTRCAVILLGLVWIGVLMTGCGRGARTPMVIFLDGASHFTSGFPVKAGLEAAGYHGHFHNFLWTSFLGYGADHFVVARSTAKARSLARQIEAIRRADTRGPIHLMGLSAGTALIISALEQLPDDVQVDHVVLFSSSVSADRSLLGALKHVRGRLYATSSPHDLILANLPLNADGLPGPPAGRTGFRIPHGLTPEQRRAYAKVVNLRWDPGYIGFGWNGGHVRATSAEFVRSVIAPRVLSADPFPLDRPLVHEEQTPATTPTHEGSPSQP